MRQAAPGPVALGGGGGGGQGYGEGNRGGITWQLSMRRSYSYITGRIIIYFKLTIDTESIVSFFLTVVQFYNR